jgi:hypothetical protein
MINKNKIIYIKWLLYGCIIFNSRLLNYFISNNFKFEIVDMVFCPIFGSNLRCNLVLSASWFGFFSGTFLILAEFFIKKENRNCFNDKKIQICSFQFIFWSSLFFICRRWILEVWEKKDFIEANVSIRFYFSIILNAFLFLFSGIICYVS